MCVGKHHPLEAKLSTHKTQPEKDDGARLKSRTPPFATARCLERAALPGSRREALLRLPPQVVLSAPIPLRQIRSFVVPDEPGVYLIHDLRGVLYVGRTINLRRRFREHCDARGNELIAVAQRSVFGLLSFSWETVMDRRQRAQLEHELVSWLRPPCNRAIPGRLL